MDKLTKQIYMVLLFLLLIGLGIIQVTGTGTFFGIDINVPLFNPETNSPVLVIGIPQDIRIISFISQKEIYSPGETARVKFIIENNHNLPYNISVNWFFNNSRYWEWKNNSIENYNPSEKENIFESWLPVGNNIGKWEVQLLISYEIRNKTIIKEEVELFRVI